jgi:hypothetical protein
MRRSASTLVQPFEDTTETLRREKMQLAMLPQLDGWAGWWDG